MTTSSSSLLGGASSGTSSSTSSACTTTSSRSRLLHCAGAYSKEAVYDDDVVRSVQYFVPSSHY